MKANTAGDEVGTAALVENLKQFVESNDDKVPHLPLSKASRLSLSVASLAFDILSMRC